LKRIFDIVVALTGLLISSVIIVPVAVAVWLQDFKSPFYLGPRVARGGGMFKMVKLRSMVVKADKTGVDSTGASDPRITPIGRFIRAYKLDEITQLWNVLWGEMSLVGPRPLPLYEASRIKGVQRRRLAMRPGLSGLWQTRGRSTVDFDEWMRMDLEYVDQWSLALDLRILLATVPEVLRGTGAH